MEIIKLTIPTMKSSHCQITGGSTVNAMGGKVKSIASTQAEIELSNGLTKESLIAAIEKSGFIVSNKF